MTLGISRRTGALVTAGVLLASGGAVAYAYPPGQAFAVNVVGQSPATNGTQLTIDLTNADPRCDLVVVVDGGQARNVTRSNPANNRARLVVTTTQTTGTVRVTARTRGCAVEERATTTAVIRQSYVTAPTRREVGAAFTVTATGFPNGRPITVTASRSGAAPVVQSGATNGSGEARVRFPGGLPQDGTWALVASTADGANASTSIRIVPASPGSLPSITATSSPSLR